jgi:hypothetical protein
VFVGHLLFIHGISDSTGAGKEVASQLPMYLKLAIMTFGALGFLLVTPFNQLITRLTNYEPTEEWTSLDLDPFYGFCGGQSAVDDRVGYTVQVQVWWCHVPKSSSHCILFVG